MTIKISLFFVYIIYTITGLLSRQYSIFIDKIDFVNNMSMYRLVLLSNTE
ncbi:hypothetical protein D3OALGA1CA_1035 [Olavius algarvensis associated proteobacterium Delta 3]|nr:hypothetical protein D3OALGA1CA_1035 [Olavius algarvensis associated proteobacterium Delta 3]CAB5130892.1 hypothetical protein D3OALGB2SA_3625 [Olavius algarvensis associated proteobacterium Delta 3]